MAATAASALWGAMPDRPPKAPIPAMAGKALVPHRHAQVHCPLTIVPVPATMLGVGVIIDTRAVAVGFVVVAMVVVAAVPNDLAFAINAATLMFAVGFMMKTIPSATQWSSCLQ